LAAAITWPGCFGRPDTRYTSCGLPRAGTLSTRCICRRPLRPSFGR